VVLLDIALPGMDGWQVAERLRRQPAKKEPFLIAVAGLGRPADRRRSQEAGIHLHLLKPVDPDCLLSVLRRFQSFLLPGDVVLGKDGRRKAGAEGGAPLLA
jgi:CheY-like chemotaxis protein